MVLTNRHCSYNIAELNGRHSYLSTATSGLEAFQLFYEELVPSKTTISRLRRARPTPVKG